MNYLCTELIKEVTVDEKKYIKIGDMIICKKEYEAMQKWYAKFYHEFQKKIFFGDEGCPTSKIEEES